MKKRNLKLLDLNKKSISNLNLFGGTAHINHADSTVIVCTLSTGPYGCDTTSLSNSQGLTCDRCPDGTGGGKSYDDCN
ncbi:hypothetical protein [Kordia sp.]|uniref:hypothetical protein n=1 Tax=Kordia sp. TaxID=1965332 RepID=UPI003B5C83B5